MLALIVADLVKSDPQSICQTSPRNSHFVYMTNVRLSHVICTRLTDFRLTGNGSDVFGSDICTCKPYLTFAIEECIRCAQRGGVGVVVYFRKEGRALGEVTK